MMRKYKISIAIGALLVFAGLAFPLWDSTVLLSMGVALIAAAWMRGWRSGAGLDRDERTDKLAAYGIAYSWLITFSLSIVLLLLDLLRLFSLSSQGVLELIVLVMAGSAAILKWHLLRQGDLV
ncbi:MAG: hypothetical protein JW986_11380 [Methanotrichaceae archaeon]|nr:hypothetical protein [Methanotrichaceae archaeon]